MKDAGNAALAPIPLDTAPGGAIDPPAGGVDFLQPLSPVVPIAPLPVNFLVVPTPHTPARPVPEPSALAILATALAGVALFRPSRRFGGRTGEAGRG
ncbi:PEP-CTERM sorting domain-containing protein [Acidiphilium sp.]|uniref:PEP-CTERM sorting domain-containing protein n=1 Tax=Acidiphilium sp. TaxID=527 RepID=UPI003D08ADA3